MPPIVRDSHPIAWASTAGSRDSIYIFLHSTYYYQKNQPIWPTLKYLLYLPLTIHTKKIFSKVQLRMRFDLAMEDSRHSVWDWRQPAGLKGIEKKNYRVIKAEGPGDLFQASPCCAPALPYGPPLLPQYSL